MGDREINKRIKTGMISRKTVDDIFQKALCERPLTRMDIKCLLSLDGKEERERLFEIARILRQRYFSGGIFLYGFVYFSTYCRNHCTFCVNSASNGCVQRYRKDPVAIIDACRHLTDSGVHCIDLTMGEDPYFYQNNDNFGYLKNLVRDIKNDVGLPLMLSPGALPRETLIDFADEEIDWYSCYQESYNPTLFQKLRPGQDYEYRLNIKYFAKSLGLLVEEGILIGIGEDAEDIVTSLCAMSKLGPHQVRVMRFIPHKNVPLRTHYGDIKKTELLIIGILRLLFPDRLIPASLDIDGITTLEERLNAGANVITSLVPPSMGLSGVAQPSLDIDGGNRSVEKVLPIVKKCGLEPASRDKYSVWVKKEREKIRPLQLCK